MRVRPAACHRPARRRDPTQEIGERLGPIGFDGGARPGWRADVSLPSWRPDCDPEIDVIEEIARHVGYERPRAHRAGVRRSPAGLTVQAAAAPAAPGARGLGLSEAMPNPFLAPGELGAPGSTGTAITIANPLVTEESVLRTSLRPGLVKAVAYNGRTGRRRRAVRDRPRLRAGEGPLPDEWEALVVLLAGREGPAAVPLWREVALRSA